MHFQFRQQRYRIVLRARPLFFFGSVVMLCVMLGIWQLKRFDYKNHLTKQAVQNSTPLDLNQQPDATIKPFQQVTAVGDYQPAMTMYVQNKPHDDKMGYEVLTAMRILPNKPLLLIDRGWLEGKIPANSIYLPTQIRQRIAGAAKYANEYQFILGDNIAAQHSRPIVMQKIDVAQLSHITGEVFYPFVIQLAADNLDGFLRDWSIVTVPASRHLGYAIQWFIMAFALIIASALFCCERNPHEN